MSTSNIRKKLIRLFIVPSALVLYIGLLPLAIADGGGTYSAYDADRDGYLDRAEFEKFAEAKRKRSSASDAWQFDNVDSDGDDKISEQEMVNALIEEIKHKKKNR